MSGQVDCPYCGHVNEIEYSEGHGVDEGVLHEQECSGCEKYFVFSTHITFSHEAKKADCLNGGEHDYKPTCTYPIEFTEMACTMCDHRRKLTDDEMKELLKNER